MGAALILAILTFWAVPLAAIGALRSFAGREQRFNLPEWETTRLVGLVLNRSTRLLGHRVATDAEIQAYFDLLSKARQARRSASAAAGPGSPAAHDSRQDALLSAAARLRPLVEARFERAVAGAVRQAGLVESLPVFPGVSIVWPPVATGFAVPPHILLLSPRDRIALTNTRLLRSDLSLPDASRIEHGAQSRTASALVDQVGGLSAYPSIVDQDESPLGLMQTVAHEWMHAYLIFHPLGARYAQSGELTLINETVADLVGRELGGIAFDTLGLPAAPPPSPSRLPPPLDFNRTMHDLRIEVDGLLKAGNVDEAERRMDETQRLLASKGYGIRKLNQAYFAFYGSYGDNAASSSPLGGRIAALRRLSPNLAAFVHGIQDVTQPADLDRLTLSK